MAQEEPTIPVVDGDGIQDDTKAPEKDDSKVIKDDAQDGKGSEESSKAAEEQNQKLMEAWKEDREYYEKEIGKFRAEAKNPTLTQKEEDELNDIDDPDERAEKKFEFRQKRETALNEAKLEAVKREIRFNERTDPEFAKNKKDILQVAQDYDCKDLKQAKLIWRGLNADKVKKDAEYHDKRKKDADGKGGGNAGGKTAGKPYDPKTDGKKSFGDLYREGLSG